MMGPDDFSEDFKVVWFLISENPGINILEIYEITGFKLDEITYYVHQMRLRKMVSWYNYGLRAEDKSCWDLRRLVPVN